MFANTQDKLIAAGLAGVLALSIVGNVSQWFEVRDLKTANATLDDLINNEVTGYVTRLATCRSNVLALEKGVSDQNASIAAAAAKGATAIAEATKSVADAQTRTAAAQREAADILKSPPAGSTVCEQAESVDRRIMGSLK